MRIEHSLPVGNIHSAHDERGLSLLELMFASLVMVIGLMGGMVLITTTIANNNRSKWDSTATLLSQMTLEKIASVPANATGALTITDCNPSPSAASHSLSVGAGGAPLSSNGDIDFSAATVTGYSMQYYNCQASTGERQMIYDVRWNIKTISPNAKLVTVSTQIAGNVNRGGNFFVRPVSLKMIVGCSRESGEL